GMMLAVIMLLSHALAEWFGNAGVLILSALSGITDVDAISLALGRQSIQILSVTTAALGILIAASVNTDRMYSYVRLSIDRCTATYV
ncbi:DUF4010 domain-containing protein, partial [Vibrio parahaemolyticus]|uniref:DUF4010 domain-containing protein n=1 Tax=Vibrio parahaemolyticus TaxID=670 RepID=UPI0006C269A2